MPRSGPSRPDHLTYTLTLRDATWSDGTPFTSADVLFTFKAIYDPKVSSVLGLSLQVNGKPLQVSAPDAKTVVITYPSVFGAGIKLLDNLVMAPKHKLEAALDAGTFPEAWSVSTPLNELVAIGPFTIARYEPGQRVLLEKNPRYWKKDAAGMALPYLDRIVLERVPDQNAELVRLQSGQVDMLQQQVRPEDIATLRPLVDQKKLQLIELGVTSDPDMMFFNLRPALLDQGSAGRVDDEEGIPPGHLARDRSRGVRQHGVPRRGGSDLGPGDTRKQELVLAQRASIPALVGSRQRTAGRSWPGES